MTTNLALTFFTGATSVDSDAAVEMLRSDTLDTASLENDLLLLTETSDLEPTIVNLLHALREGKSGKTKELVSKLADGIRRLPKEEWRTTVQLTNHFLAPPLFAKTAQTVSVSKALSSSTSLSADLEKWKKERERFDQSRDILPDERGEWFEKLEESFVSLARKMESLEDLLSVLGVLPSLHFQRGTHFVKEMTPLLRRAILKFWRPGVVLPFAETGVFLGKLFLESSWLWDANCLPNPDAEDEAVIARMIAPVEIIRRGAKHFIFKGLEAVSSPDHSLYERMLAGMAVLHMGPWNCYFDIRNPEPQASLFFFKKYIEARAAEQKLDPADLLLVAHLAAHKMDGLLLKDYSLETQQALLKAVVYWSPWSDTAGALATPFEAFFDSDLLFQLSKDLRFLFARDLFQKGIATHTHAMEQALADNFLWALKPEHLDELLSLYERDPETTLFHIQHYLKLLKALALTGVSELMKRHTAHLLSLVDVAQVAQHAEALKWISNDVHHFHFTPGGARKFVLSLIEVIREAVSLAKNPGTKDSQFFLLAHNGLRLLLNLDDRFHEEGEASWALPLASSVPIMLEKSLIDPQLFFDFLGRIIPYQSDEWVAQAAEKIFLLFVNAHRQSFLCDSSVKQPDADFVALLKKRISPDELGRMSAPVVEAYFSNPFDKIAEKQKELLKKVLGEALPAVESEAGLRKVVEHSKLALETKERALRLILNREHPLTPAWRLLIAKTIAEANEDEAKMLFFQNITAATSADGMVYEWVLLLRDFQQLGTEDQKDFVTDQNIRFAKHGHPVSLTPPRIRKTMRHWLRERFLARIALSGKETLAFQEHTTRFAKAWQAKGFLNYLSAMASFVDEEGKKAIKALVMGIVRSPVEAGSRDFSFAFRWRGMEKGFGQKFIDQWRKERIYPLNRVKPLSPAEAKMRFARRIGRQLEEHLEPYIVEGQNIATAPLLVSEELRKVYLSLANGDFPERERVEGLVRFFDDHKEELKAEAYASLREVRNDLSELLRGWNRSFESTDPGRVRFSGDPRDILRAGIIGQKTCTRPTDEAAGNRQAQPVGRAVHGPLLIAIIERDGEEIGRVLVEAAPGRDGAHLTVWRLYAEGGFNDEETLEEVLLKDARLLGIPPERVHISFSKRNMSGAPTLLPSHFATYNEDFHRPEARAAVSP